MEGGTAPSRGAATSFKKGQLLPAVRRTDRGLPPSENTRTPALAVGKKAARLGCNPPPLRHARRRLVPCGHAPALAAGKKAARLGCPPASRRAREAAHGTGAALSRRPKARIVLCGHAPPPGGRGGSLPRNEPQERTTLPRRQAHRHVCFSLTPACSHPAGHGLFEKNPC